MTESIIEILNQFGYIGVFLLIMIENLFPPIPSEVILTFSGFMTTYTEMNVWGVIFAATAGSLMGALMLYMLGRVLNTNRLEALFGSKLGKALHLKTTDVRRAGRWFIKRGNKAVFLCRFVPIVRSLISIPAGTAKMHLGTFVALTTAGTLIWNIVLVYLGRIAGNAWSVIAHYVDIYAAITAVVLVLIAGVIGVVFIKKRFLSR